MGAELLRGRKVMCSYLDLLASAACKRQEKISKYHQEKKQTGNQNMCEQVRQEITYVLGVIMYFPKRGEITPAEDAGISGGIPSPPSFGSVWLIPLGAADKPLKSSLLSCFCSSVCHQEATPDKGRRTEIW